MLRVLALQDDKFFSYLYSNNLRWLRNLKQLQHLDMAGINLTEASDWLQVISTLPLLQELHLSSCSLSQIPSDPATVSFTSLVVLDLSENMFNSLLPGWIFSLHNLESLDLTRCLFGALDLGTHSGFHSMPSLRTLRVSSNNFFNSSSILNGLFSLSYLRFLDVNNCNISGPVLGNLQNFSLIVHLDLSNNQIDEAFCLRVLI
ncbi:leucine-rich repeat protein [Tanacetum coccineum]